MFNINMKFDDVIVESVQKTDIAYIQKWFNYQQLLQDDKYRPFDILEFYERFLEYYLSEGEFFLKIIKDNKFIGIIKGCIEFKNPNTVWVRCFMIDKKYRNLGLGDRILKEMTGYLKKNHDISLIFAGIMKGNNSSLKFLKRNGFKIMRVVKEFYEIDDEKIDMLILRK